MIRTQVQDLVVKFARAAERKESIQSRLLDCDLLRLPQRLTTLHKIWEKLLKTIDLTFYIRQPLDLVLTARRTASAR